MKIDVNKKYTYRNGEPAIIVTTNYDSEKYPVQSQDHDGNDHLHTAEGRFFVLGTKSMYDLIEVIQEPEPAKPERPMIDINKKYRYRNGEPATIVATGYDSEAYPVRSRNPDGGIRTHIADGRYYDDGGESQFDLIEITPEPEPIKPERPMIDANKKYTSGGHPVELLHRSPDGWPTDFKWRGIVNGVIQSWNDEGVYIAPHTHRLNLIEVREPRKFRAYVNKYGMLGLATNISKEDLDLMAPQEAPHEIIEVVEVLP